MLIGERQVDVRHFHLFCGLAGGALGFNSARAHVGRLRARFRCIGGVDVDAAAVRDFTRLTGVQGTVLDLFDREQYLAWHGHEPPDGWREATPEDLRRAAGGERPNIVFTSPPCKGFSGLLAQDRAAGPRYQALNKLALRGVWLALEAWADDPPELILLENVPRIAQRGRPLIDSIGALYRHYGYVYAETSYDCGELGNLAQSRKRFLMVARHAAKVPPFLYQPPRRGLRAVGEVIGRLPLPGDPAAGPMHQLRPLQWKTWVRLAFVEAGSDWRSLQRLRVVEGHLADFGIAPSGWHRGPLGVVPWGSPSGTVTGAAMPTTGAFSVADPRAGASWRGHGKYIVTPADDPAPTVIGASATGNGAFAVADPRCNWSDKAYRNKLKVIPFDQPAGTVIGARSPDGGACSVADPRPVAWKEYGQLGVIPFDQHAGTVSGQSAPGGGYYSVADPRLGEGPRGPHFNNVYRVVAFDQPAGTVTAGSAPSSGGQAVADPRVALAQGRGAYGVLTFDEPAGAITGKAGHDNGRFSVADPRAGAGQVLGAVLPAAADRLVCLIIALDGTWHRPFTTLELAALQSFPVEEAFELDGTSDTAHRERIGNAVPPHAAAAMGSEMGRTLLLAWSGETFALSDTDVWVRPVAIALSVHQGELA